MSLKNRVHKTLKNNYDCRDNDFTLCTHIWNEECRELGVVFTDLSAVMFIHYVTKGKLSKQQSILRYRRLINDEFPQLKGKSYNAKTKTKKKFLKRKPLPNMMNNIDSIYIKKKSYIWESFE